MNILWVVVLVALAACGEDNGGNDTILTGFSGILIFGLVAWIVFRYVSKKRG